MTYQREAENRLRIAVVGTGGHAYRNILPTLHYLPVKLEAVCDLNEDLARRTAAEYGCRHYVTTKEMYAAEELDAVLLVVSPSLHPMLTIEAFEHGLHVWMEKPVAMRAEEVTRMIAKRADRIAVVGFKKSFMPSARKAIEISRSENYGNVRSILAVYPMTLPQNGQEVLDTGMFTNWLGNCCHPISFMMAVGGSVKTVTAHSNELGYGSLILEFANGVMGNFHFSSGPLPSETYSVFGDSWNLTIDNSQTITLQRGMPFSYSYTNNYAPAGDDTGAVVWRPQNTISTLENKSVFTQGLYGELEYFCRCIMEGTPAVDGSLEFALEVMKVYEAALISNGKPITIDE